MEWFKKLKRNLEPIFTKSSIKAAYYSSKRVVIVIELYFDDGQIQMIDKYFFIYLCNILAAYLSYIYFIQPEKKTSTKVVNNYEGWENYRFFNHTDS